MNNSEILEKFMEAGLVHLPDIYLNAPWKYSWEELIYNIEGNVEDLEEADGATYSGFIKSSEEIGDYIIFDVDSGCGWDYQVILTKANKVEES